MRLARAASAGFTLIELMVVVVLVAILALIAAPAMRVARDDRMAFDYARQIQQMVQRARARAAGRGAAHLIVAGPSGTRGRVWMWEALDNTAAPGGPNPVSSCKNVGQWAPVTGFAPGATAPSNVARIIDGLELNTPGVNVDADIRALFYIGDTSAVAVSPAIAICYTPNGATFASGGTDMTDAFTQMQTNPPFTGVADIQITRHDAAANVVGLTRHVLITGSAAPRVQSK